MPSGRERRAKSQLVILLTIGPIIPVNGSLGTCRIARSAALDKPKKKEKEWNDKNVNVYNIVSNNARFIHLSHGAGKAELGLWAIDSVV